MIYNGMKHLKGFRLFENSDESEWSEEEVNQILENPDEAKNPFIGTNPKDSAMMAFSLLVKMSEVIGQEMGKKQFLNLIKYLININDIKLASYMLSSAKEIFDNLHNPEYKKMEYIFDKYYYPGHFYDMFAAKQEAGVYSKGETGSDVEEYIKSVDPSKRPRKKLYGKELQNAINSAIERGDHEELKILGDMIPESLKNKYNNLIMKHVKNFKLFEGNYVPSSWTSDEFEQVLNDPENAENPFSSASVIGKNEVGLEIDAFIKAWNNLGYNATPHQFLNLVKYLTIIDEPRIAISVLSKIMTSTKYLQNKEYVYLTHYFDKYYYPEQLDYMVREKIKGGAYPLGTNLKKLDDYVDEVDSSTMKIEIRPDKLKGQELQDAIDAALDAGDFKEVERLSAMMESLKRFK
jgi:hypothetical protein